MTRATVDLDKEREDESRSRARVLLVDDDERNLLALKTVIEDVADVVTAASGEEALRYLLKFDFAAILLDVFMPVMDGYETAQIIRQREMSKRIPIIFLSAVNKEDAHLRRGYAMGAVDYVFKPVEPLILRSKVAVFVDLYEKTRDIQRKALAERKLRDENLRVQRDMLLAEQALRRAEQRQAVIVKSLPIVLYLEPLDSFPRVPSYVSGDLKALTGFELAEVKANPTLWSDRIHPEDRAGVVAARAAIRGEEPLSLEYRWQAADGEWRHLLERAVVLRDPETGAAEVAGTLLDVTNQRQLEDQLAHSQKMDAVGKLTGGIAHDFNNLLAAVLGGLGLIEKRVPLDAQQQKLIDLTRRSAEQGADLVKRLLSFARRQNLQAAAVPIDRLVIALNGLLEHTLGGLVEVEWRMPDDAWPVFADGNQLELALMNLILNARDAMPEGGVIIVSAEHRDAPDRLRLAAGDYVALTVADSGTGIAPDVLGRIFEPFFTTKEAGKGTGLGLSMVYGFAEQSGGAVTVESEPDRGTAFTLWLPRAVEETAPAGGGTVEALPTAAPPLRVLLVDDHAAVRATAEEMLRELGHELQTAASALEAMALLERDVDAVDLIVTDYAMPGMSGAELIRGARALRPAMPAVMITGYVDDQAFGEGVERAAFLGKPFTAAALNAALVEALGAVAPEKAAIARPPRRALA